MYSIEFDPESHSYLVDGQPYPNVTSILSAEGLNSFAFANEGHRQRGSDVHTICNLIDYGWRDGIPESVTTPEEVLACCDWEPAGTDPRLVPYGYSYIQFLLRSRPVWKYIEKPVASKTYGFVGTLDRFGAIAGKTSTVDIKSGEPSDSADPQVALYALALEEMEGLPSEECFALWLWKDGKTFRKVPGKGRGLSVGISAVTLYKFRKERGLFT